MALPQKLDIANMQTTWATQLNPVIANAILNGLQLSSITLVTGDNIVNHLLARKQLGWFATDINAAATLYRSAPFNDKTLTLNASAGCVVNLWVY